MGPIESVAAGNAVDADREAEEPAGASDENAGEQPEETKE